jgi:hypothetical protein
MGAMQAEPAGGETPEAAARRVLEGTQEATSEAAVLSLAAAICEASRLAGMPTSRIADALRVARLRGYQLYTLHTGDEG